MVQFAVERAVRGVAAGDIEIGNGPGNCAYSFRVGERYVVYAHKVDEQKIFVTNMCAGTKPLANAATDLTYFDELDRPATGGRVYGQIRSVAPNFESGGMADRGPLSNVPLTLTRGIERTRLATNAAGQFEFTRLAPGEYELRADLPRQFAPWRPVRLRIPNDRACVALDSGAWLDGRIKGTLLDETGKPAAGAAVEVAAASTKGSSKPPPHIAKATADRNGAFEFTQLPPGDYVVGTELSRAPAMNRRDRRRYYPGALAPDAARVVHLDEASRVELDRFQLPAFPAERVIDGVVLGADGQPASGATVTLYGAGPESHVSADGRFRFTLPYGARFIISAKKQVTTDGRVVWAQTGFGVDIEREDRDRTVELRLKIP
jgi:hypothetical protein